MMTHGKVALVTGAAGQGMGRSIALTLAREGAYVVVNYRASSESAQAIVAHIEAQGGRAIAVQADVFTAEGCRALFDATRRAFGRVDICVIGPGAGWHGEPVDRLSPAGVAEDVQHELAPFLHLMPLVLPGMYERRWGRIIGIAMHPTRLSPAYAYNLGKAARIQALLLAHEQAWRNGVTMNVIAPGPVAGILTLEEAVALCDHREAWPARGNVSPQDIAEGVAFLCSEAGRFVTGCVLPYLFNK
jgi:NAD(P)-dependent dehydrogenase (short-subunit alcohol dehydrogenase family)